MRRSRWDEWVEPDRSTPKLEPTFGVKAFGTNTTCADIHPGHRDPETGIRDGKLPANTRLCCMVCHRTGEDIDGREDMQVTPADRIELQRWLPEGGRDQWSRGDGTPAEPTVYNGPTKAESATTRRRQLKQFRRSVRPMDPDQLAREADAGRARTIA